MPPKLEKKKKTTQGDGHTYYEQYTLQLELKAEPAAQSIVALGKTLLTNDQSKGLTYKINVGTLPPGLPPRTWDHKPG
jgi:hypothetical protein